MRQIYLTFIALLCVSSATYAQSDARTAGAASAGDGQSPGATPVGLQPFGRVVRNANDCAPDHPDAVWSAGGAFVGYACTDSANGQ